MKLASLIVDGRLPSLEILDLEDNDIDDESALFLAHSFSTETTPNMHEFYLGGNAIGDKGVEALFRSFRNNSMNSIARVSLNRMCADLILCVEINVGYEGIKFMSNSVLLHCMEGVEFLTLAGNSIDSKGFIMIMKSIERGGFPKLEVLDMRGWDMC